MLKTVQGVPKCSKVRFPQRNFPRTKRDAFPRTLKRGVLLRPHTLIEILDAAHLTKFVTGPYDQRGGLLIVAPPASLKTTLIEIALEEYPNALVLSDLNINTFMKMRDDLVSNRYSTMAFPEFAKLYARHTKTAANVESTIQALVEEGFKKPSFADPRTGGLKARMFVVGGMTPTFYDANYDNWQKSGFIRRFIVSLFNVSNPEAITDAIREWKKLNFGDVPRRWPTKQIEMGVTDAEAKFLQRALRDQADDKTPLVILMRIYSVLKWKYEKKEPEKPRKIMEDFIPTLSKNGGMMTIEEVEK